ncbi:MAG: quinolinate synthase NadA [Acidobacteria bacterium]|nr:quinolinate synthase NadA [Acidobacteriota bacterium]
MERELILKKIDELKKKKDVVILAHNYQLPDIQDIADFVGDSLGLSQKAATVKEKIILFCGVHFMAETVSILCPEKKVLIPDVEAGCSLSDSLTLAQIKEWKKRYPDAVVVTYVNTSAEVKAESDYCVTSSNAVKVVNSIPENKMILFGPDMFLGSYVSRVTGRKNIRLWAGECHVHAAVSPNDIEKARKEHPNAKFLIHPECGCVTSCMIDAYDKGESNSIILSTEGMIREVEKTKEREYVVATEKGILHRLEKISPESRFYLVSDALECKYMKMINIEKVLNSLENEVYEVKVSDGIREKAIIPIQRMIEIT